MCRFFCLLTCWLLGSVYASGQEAAIDSSFVEYEVVEAEPVSSDVLLPENEVFPAAKQQKQTNYAFFVFLVLCTLVVGVSAGFRKELMQAFQAVWNINKLMQWYRVVRNQSLFFLWVLNACFLFVVVLSFHSYFSSGNFQKDATYDFLKWSQLSLFFLFFFSGNVFTSILLAWLLEKIEIAYTLLSFRLLINALSLFALLIPVSLLLLSFPGIGQVCTILLMCSIALIWLWNEIMAIRLFISERLNVASFHFFLYICTLKIIPVLIGYKLLVRFIY